MAQLPESIRILNEQRKREYYKAAALEGILASSTAQGGVSSLEPAELAKTCGVYADAMLAEDRENEKG